MATDVNVTQVSLLAGEDLRGAEFKIVTFVAADGDFDHVKVAAKNEFPRGVLYHGAESGQPVGVAISGFVKVRFGEDLVPGDAVGVGIGGLAVGVTGFAGTYVLGTCREGAKAGEVGSVQLFPQP